MDDAFYEPVDGGFLATERTRGPWHDDFQHGGPPAALLTRVLLQPGFFLARVTIELLRPVPIGRLEVRADPGRAGRTVRRPTAELWAEGQLVATASGILVRRTEGPVVTGAAPATWPDPETLQPYGFTFFRNPVAYHTAVDLRLAHGTWGSTPIGFWARPTVELVRGSPTLPVERVMLLADAQSGMGVPLHPDAWSFVNPDLTVYFERDPADGWYGFDIRSTTGSQGSGLAQSAIRDAQGLVARSAQSLVVQPR